MMMYLFIVARSVCCLKLNLFGFCKFMVMPCVTLLLCFSRGCCICGRILRSYCLHSLLYLFIKVFLLLMFLRFDMIGVIDDNKETLKLGVFPSFFLLLTAIVVVVCVFFLLLHLLLSCFFLFFQCGLAVWPCA